MAFNVLLFFSFVLFFYLHLTKGEEVVDYESQLRNDLFVNKKINNQTRPTKNYNDTLNVFMHLYVFHILELNEKSEVLTLNAWLGQHWEDYNLVWKPKDYGGIEHINVLPQEIWTPDLTLLNNAQATMKNPEATVPAYVRSDGRVFWWPPVTFKSICPVDLSKFPFDKQVCHLLFISWSYLGYQVNITQYEEGEFDPYLFDEHNEWELTSIIANRTTFEYEGELYYAEINYFVNLQRHAPYYQLSFVVPVAAAILFTLVTFWIPPSFSTSKLFLSGINVLVFLIMVVNLYWVVPRSGSNVPAIVVCCGNGFFFASLTFLLSLASTSVFHHPPSTPPPDWLKNLLNGWLGVILCLSIDKKLSGDGPQLLANEEGQESTVPEPSKKNLKSDWQMVASAMDKAGFIIYCISLCIFVTVAVL